MPELVARIVSLLRPPARRAAPLHPLRIGALAIDRRAKADL